MIFLSSSWSQPRLKPPASDWALHLLAYAILSALTCRALGGGLHRPLQVRAAFFGALASVIYGVSDEFHQAFVPGRDSSIGDLASDAAGAALAAGILIAVTRARSRPVKLPSVTLYTRRGCHLCEEARSVLEAERRSRPFEMEVRDIDSDPAMARRFGEQVPVVFVEGRKAFKFHVDAKRLRRRLDRQKS
jgi:glutaredoxin